MNEHPPSVIELPELHSTEPVILCEVGHQFGDHPATWLVGLTCGCQHFACDAAKRKAEARYLRYRERTSCSRCNSVPVRIRLRIRL